MNVQRRISLRSTSYAGQAIQSPMMNNQDTTVGRIFCFCYFSTGLHPWLQRCRSFSLRPLGYGPTKMEL